MATDKQIFQLPDITLSILQSGVDISFVAQVQGYGMDFQVPTDILLQYVNSNYMVGLSGGVPVPDNANGNNGDIYIQNNGNVYQKVSGSWIPKATINAVPQPLIFTRNAGTVAPYSLTAPQLATLNLMGRYPNFMAFIGGVEFEDIDPTYTGSPGAFTAVSVPLHADGGLNLETTVLQFS